MVDISTPNGYIVRLKRNYLTYGEKLKLQELYLKNTKINTKDPNNSEFNASVVFEAQKLAFEILIKEIETKDKQLITEKLYDYVLNMRDEDGQAIFDALNKITTPQTQESIRDLEKKIG